LTKVLALDTISPDGYSANSCTGIIVYAFFNAPWFVGDGMDAQLIRGFRHGFAGRAF
jgi:hypothetical protein